MFLGRADAQHIPLHICHQAGSINFKASFELLSIALLLPIVAYRIANKTASEWNKTSALWLIFSALVAGLFAFAWNDLEITWAFGIGYALIIFSGGGLGFFRGCKQKQDNGIEGMRVLAACKYCNTECGQTCSGWQGGAGR
jgi:hypothetical protein